MKNFVGILALALLSCSLVVGSPSLEADAPLEPDTGVILKEQPSLRGAANDIEGEENPHRRLIAQKEIPNNTFVIHNKKYPQAKIAQWGTHGRSVGTYEHGPKTDQLWFFKESSEGSGWFYIENVQYDGYRLAKWGWRDDQTGVHKGHHSEDQLWRLEPASANHYYIVNMKYPARLAKWGQGDSDFGSYGGGKNGDQEWKLVPRFKAEIKDILVWSMKNSGTNDVSHTMSVTEGFESNEHRIHTKTKGFKWSIKIGFKITIKGITISAEEKRTFSMQFKRTLERSRKSWESKTSEVKITVPTGKTVELRQYAANFRGPVGTDKLAFKGNYRLVEK